MENSDTKWLVWIYLPTYDICASKLWLLMLYVPANYDYLCYMCQQTKTTYVIYASKLRLLMLYVPAN